MSKVKYVFFFLTLLISVSSCQYEEVKYLGVSNFSNFNQKDKEFFFHVDVKANNPNTYNIKIKPSTLDVYLDEKKIGVVHLDEKVKLVKKMEDVYTAKLRAQLDKIKILDIGTQILFKSPKLIFKGQVKAGTAFFYKRFDINESRELDAALFKRLLEKIKL